MSNIIDDGKYEWEEVYEELKKYIEEDLIKRRVNNNKEYEEIYGMLCVIRDFIKDTIHNKLYKNRDLENGVDYNELKIREIVKYVIAKILPYINILIIDLKGKIGKDKDMDILVMYDKYLDIEDDFYAIASYRSLLHFAHYMERDDDASQLVWKYNMNDTMGSIFYYSNAMILDHKFDTLIKQCPTGYGKCIDENTNVFTPNGNVKIKDINIGDYVYSMKDNEIVKRRVLNKWNTTKKQVKIKTRSGKEIITSKEHRMFTQRGYVESENLTTNDFLYSMLLQRYFYLDKIVSIEYIDEEIPMVDIEVEETHNFIANGLVSHNSKSDCVIISFCFGYDINDDIGKWVGNPKLVKVNTKGIVEMIKSKKFAKVFPEFQFDNKDDIFSKCAIGDGEFTLSKSKKQISFGCYNKATDTNGLRFNKQFFDDITQMQDAENVAMHEKDIATYEGEWKKRQYDEYNVLRWFTGTAYHREDFLSYIRKINAHNNPLIKDDNLKTRWAKFVRLNDTKKCVYISIPKLADLELGEDKCYSTFPQKYSKVEALRDLHKSESARRRFYAMEQQQPQPPETMRFDHSYFRHYKELPKEIMENDCYTYVIIDPNRKGKDNYAGLIFKEPLSEINRFYLVDCYYKKTNSKVAIPCICERAHHHLADYIIYEENTTDSSLLEEKINEEMSKYSDYEFQIDSIYSTEKKEVKINNNSDFILDNIVLPSQDMYYEDSDMGRCINDIVNYTFENNKLNDDSIDCCAMLGEYKGKHNENELKILDDIFF